MADHKKYALSPASEQMLRGVHPDLAKVIRLAATRMPFQVQVLEGIRSMAQQRANVKKGVSWTLRSRHLTGHAVDLIPMVDINRDGTITTAEKFSWPLYYQMAPIVKQCAKELGVSIEWGGDWKKNKDGPHWQLPWGAYPAARSNFLDTQEAATGRTFEDGYYHADAYEDYMDGEKVDPQTEHGAATQATATGVTGGLFGGSLAYDPATTLLSGLMSQQYELTSGDTARLILGVLIIGLSVWGAYKAARG